MTTFRPRSSHYAGTFRLQTLCKRFATFTALDSTSYYVVVLILASGNFLHPPLASAVLGASGTVTTRIQRLFLRCSGEPARSGICIQFSVLGLATPPSAPATVSFRGLVTLDLCTMLVKQSTRKRLAGGVTWQATSLECRRYGSSLLDRWAWSGREVLGPSPVTT